MDKSLNEIVADDKELIECVANDCLFETSFKDEATATGAGDGRNFPKCKNAKSRSAAFSFLTALQEALFDISDDTTASATIDVHRSLSALFCNAHWRTKSKTSWSLREEAERDSTCPVGLKNLGCTCYMNSLLQQLFTIKVIRDPFLHPSPAPPPPLPPPRTSNVSCCEWTRSQARASSTQKRTCYSNFNRYSPCSNNLDDRVTTLGVSALL